MSKRITITPKIQEQIRAGIGDAEADTSGFHVYEARMLTTEPVQKGGFFNAARVTRQTMQQMADFISTPGKAIPLQVMHDTGVLPVGRVFAGKLFDMENGESELRGLFYTNRDATAKDIDDSIIDEVSVGLLTKHAFCSECNFDYFGEEASMENFWSLTCDNGHTIGEDGVHVKLAGMEDWGELSLVNRGAAKNAKIVSRAKQAMVAQGVQALAARQDFAARVLSASHSLPSESKIQPSKETSSMNLEAMFNAKCDEAATAKVELGQAKTQVETLTASNTDLQAQLTAAQAEIAELKKDDKSVELTAAREAQATAEATAAAATKELEDANTAIEPHVRAAFTASNLPEDQIPATLTERVAKIGDLGLKLHQTVGAGEPAKTAAQQTEAQQADQARTAAFKLNR